MTVPVQVHWQETPFDVHRDMIAEELGFYGGICPNSNDAFSDRAFATVDCIPIIKQR